MKKVLLIVMALIICVSMFSCSGGNDAETTAAEETEIEETKPEHVHTAKGGWDRNTK